MIDERLDRQLVSFNERYQKCFYSSARTDDIKKIRYLSNIKSLNFKRVIEDLKYRNYAKKHFSADGNIISQTPHVINPADYRIAVYSCIVGQYDSIIEPIYKEDDIDYLIFTDQDLPKNSSWSKREIRGLPEYRQLKAAQLNRKIKILQTQELLEYDYTIYIDGNIEIVSGVSPIIANMGQYGLGVHYHRRRDCIYDEVVSVKHLKRITGKDMDEQVNAYMRDGFPKHFGMYENSILIRNNRDVDTIDLMKTWWEEYLRYPTRDQLSLPYVIWKTGYNKNKVYILGNDIERNPRFNRLYNHK